MIDFVESAKSEREFQLTKAEQISEQIRQLQTEKDRALAIASRLDELIQFYGVEATPAILVPSEEIEEVEEKEPEQKISQKPASHAAYVNYLKREFKKIPITRNILNFLEAHPDETIHVDVIVKHLGRDNLTKKDWTKFKYSVNNALHRAVELGYCFRVKNGVFTLKLETISKYIDTLSAKSRESVNRSL